MGRIISSIILPDIPTGKHFTDDGTWTAIQDGGGANVKSGTVNLTAGGSAAVVFGTPFDNVPVVTVSAQFNTSDTSTTLCAHSITVNGFTLRGAGNAAGSFGWIATDAGNP